MTTESLCEVMNAIWSESELQARNRRARDYIERVHYSRRENTRWWNTFVCRSLACGLWLFVLALLMALVVTK